MHSFLRTQDRIGSIILLVASLCGTSGAVALPAPLYSWTGFYIGAETVYGASHDKFSGPGFQGTANTTFGGMGITDGFNYQILPQWVVGVQSFWDANFLPGGDPRDLGGMTIRPTSKWQAGVDGRLGFLVTPQTLVFGLVGYQWKNQDIIIGTSSEKTVGQVFYGGGVEYAVSPTIHVVGQVTASSQSNDMLFFVGTLHGSFRDVTGKAGLDVELDTTSWK
jgi:hypothetical protein